MPFAQHGAALVEMVDRVHADHGVERAVAEREPLARVGADEAGAVGEAARARGVVRRGDAGLVEIDAGHAAAGQRSHEQRRAARAARDLEQVGGAPQRKPVAEAPLLAGGEPRVLADVLAERLGPDRRMEVVRETAVRRVVEARVIPAAVTAAVFHAARHSDRRYPPGSSTAPNRHAGERALVRHAPLSVDGLDRSHLESRTPTRPRLLVPGARHDRDPRASPARPRPRPTRRGAAADARYAEGCAAENSGITSSATRRSVASSDS